MRCLTEFKLQIDSKPFKDKPKGVDIAGIKTRLAESVPRVITVRQLADEVIMGKSFSPAVLVGGSKSDNWKEQQVFCVDIDNEDKTAPKGEKRQSFKPLTIHEVFKRCEQWEIAPALIYETFSSSDEWLKFRIVFVSNKMITDGNERDEIQLALMEIFPECDSTCKNRDRLFFGGKKILYMDEQALLEPKNINTLGKAVNSRELFVQYDKANINVKDTKLDELKKSFDFLEYIHSKFAVSERRAGDYIVLNPCPICGHKEDFVFYPKTKTFMCFGANGNVGGSIIDFLIHTLNLDKKQAVDMFKYQLCGLSKNDEKAKYKKACMIKKANKIDGLEPAIVDEDIVTDLPNYIIEKINDKTGEVKYSISCPLLADYIREHSNYISINDRLAKQTRVFWYENGVYKPVSDDMLKGYIKSFIVKYDVTLLKMRDVNEVFNDLKTDLRFVDEVMLNADENIINFQNGLLNLRDMKLYPHSPKVLSTIQIPCNYNPSNNNCPVFIKFIDDFVSGDNDKAELLFQYMGVCSSNIKGYRMKQAMFMYGKGNTGKSQLKSLTERILGNENCSSVDLSALEERFGTSQLYLKRLVGSGDMSFMSVKELKVFKNATGGDDIFIEFKGRDGFRYKFTGQFWFCMNKLPAFSGDRGNWVYNRIIAFDCNNVISEDKQDKMLLDKMYEEREAIINMLIPALKKVIDNGFRYDIPQSCIINRQKYIEDNSPVITFYNECCVQRASKFKNDSCTITKIYKVFQAWYKDQFNRYAFCPSKKDFKSELAQYLKVDDLKQLEHRTERGYIYPFTLKLDVKEEYSYAYGWDS